MGGVNTVSEACSVSGVSGLSTMGGVSTRGSRHADNLSYSVTLLRAVVCRFV
jgi:hypothetical protein